MKKLLVFLAFFGFLLAYGSDLYAKADELDAAIRDASKFLNKNIRKKSKIVILNIQSPSSDLSDYIIDELIANSINDKVFSVVDRQQLDEKRGEHDIQWFKEVDDKTAVEIGKFFDAQFVVSGVMGRLGSGYRIRIRTLDVLTAQVHGQYNRNFASSPLIATLYVGGSGGMPPAVVRSSTSTAQSRPAVSEEPDIREYKVGETGPAGGIIFYDKGINSGGWRYLEAAPEEAEFQAKWSIRGTKVDNTQETIGSGKQNTQLIVEKFNQASLERDTAAQKCDDLEIGGFVGWFLPSKDELALMYENLKQKNIGGFKDEIYWTSSGGSESWGNIIAMAIRFQSGSVISAASSDMYASNTRYVRPIRQVPGP